MGIFDFLKGKESKSNDSVLRVKLDETEDIGIVTHYKGKPFTGIMYSLHENGKVEQDIEMVEGLKDGKVRNYYENGEISNEIHYIDDICTGIEKHYREDGSLELESEGHLEDDLFQGITKYYHENGDFHYTAFIEDDLIIDYDEVGWRVNLYVYSDRVYDMSQKKEVEGSTLNKLIETFIDILKKLEIYHEKFYDKFKIRLKNEIIKSEFDTGWSLRELRHTFIIACDFAFRFYPHTEGKNERLIRITAFIQLCFKNTIEIDKIENNIEWDRFLDTIALDAKPEIIMPSIRCMKKSNRIALLVLLKSLLVETIEIIDKSNKSDEEIKLIKTGMNKSFITHEEIFSASLSDELYDEIYSQFVCKWMTIT